MKLGLIGAGRIGALHADNLLAMDAVSALVVADTVRERATALARRCGADHVADVPQLLRADLDGVVIAASTDAHPDLLRAAVQADLPAFCEKPVATGLEAALALAAVAETAQVPVQIGFSRRFDAGFLSVREAVRSGSLGWVHSIRSTTMDPAPPGREFAAASGGLLRDCAIHDFDAIRWVTGQDIAEVFATGTSHGEDWIRGLDDVDTAATVLTLSDGCLAVVSNTRYNARGYDVRLEVHGSSDSVAAGLDDGLPLRSAEAAVAFPTGPPHRFFLDRFASAFRAEMSAFVDVVAGRTHSPCTVGEAVEAQLVAEAAVISLRRGTPVRVDDVRATASEATTQGGRPIWKS